MEFAFDISNQWWYWSYLQNWFFVIHTNEGSHIMTPFWSLAIEEQFYLIWPFVILLIKSKKRLFIYALTGLLFIYFIRIFFILNGNEWATNNTFTYTRYDGILIGSLIAISKCFMNEKKIFRLGLLLFSLFNFFGLIAWVIFNKNTLYFGLGGYPLLSIFFGWIIYIATQTSSKLTAVLTGSFLRIAGKYSYGLYVFHFSVMNLLHPYTEKWMWPVFNNRFPESLILLFTEILVAYIIYHTFEKHFLKLKKYFYSS